MVRAGSRVTAGQVMAASRVATLLAAGVALPRALGGPAGLRLVGDARTGAEPVLAFGAGGGEAEVVLAAAAGRDGGADLELRRGGLRKVLLGSDVAELPQTLVSGELSAASLSVGGVQQWALWDLDTFDAVDSGQWSLNDRGFCSSPYDVFLGGHCRLGAATTTRRYEALPPHTRVRVRARIHFIDDWNGELVAMQVDGQTVWAQSHEWCPGFEQWMCSKFGVDACGRGTPDRLSVKAEASLVHSSSTLDVAFVSSLAAGTDACRTSWGIDDVSVELL
mmetsp:Transcript_106900/g.297692  ORF Transcript_106900/g.297692 Transcript_106900/m.297692 type:complete len:278 (+) Transcript_106900:183-1016(+)|eukprot:CAMPEP_0179089018 /NCGR_PEP_ID=MMETSP0796-20121207/40535_1 /TAXON_ID=73915 /ORGANISM="Pyrodinium bahamense, Strain pbaha01" /LENGTH=277 /DNA_ID=CAMNT_0020786559 /DNA_START=115 /DNA_END=948 /DNA_ORIENTATION=-